MRFSAAQEAARREFIASIKKESGERMERCYQCGKCTAGCPAVEEMDYAPNRIMRLVQLGRVDEALSSRAIWVCASCATCTARCPQDVDPAGVMDALRHLALRRGYRIPEKEIAVFNRVFLLNVRWLGRLFEPAMVGMNNLFSGHLFKDVLKAPGLLLAGKLRLKPNRPDKEMRELCRRVEEMEREEG